MSTIRLAINPGVLSHELRTPLTNILYLAKELRNQKQQFTTEQYNCIEDICKQGNRLFAALDKFLFKSSQANFSDVEDENRVAVDVVRATIAKIKQAQAAAKLSILIIEDEPIIQRVHQAMLERLGYTVDIANNGEEALALYEKHQYAAILTDINMPKMNGIEVGAEIRRLEINTKKRIPIIALTADVTLETRQDCLAAGIDEVTEKPIKIDALKVIFQRYLIKK